MIATARTIQTSGIGTGNPGTFVFLNWTTGSQSSTTILAFHDGPNEPGGMNVGINWLTPTHLELTYKGRRAFDFQAVKCDGVDISVRDLASTTSSSTIAPLDPSQAARLVLHLKGLSESMRGHSQAELCLRMES
jgi:hypothetical protein